MMEMRGVNGCNVYEKLKLYNYVFAPETVYKNFIYFTLKLYCTIINIAVTNNLYK